MANTSIIEKIMLDYFLTPLRNGSKFDQAYAKLLEDFRSYDKHGTSTFLGGQTIDFIVNKIRYKIIATYYPEIASLEIRFVNIDKFSYNITGDAKMHAMRVYSNVMYGVQDMLQQMKVKTGGYVPVHIYFAGDNKDPNRIELYDKLCKYKPVVKMLNSFNYIKDDIYAKTILDFVKKQENDKKDNYIIYCFTLKEQI